MTVCCACQHHRLLEWWLEVPILVLLGVCLAASLWMLVEITRDLIRPP